MHRPVSRRTCIQDADIINPAVGCPPEVERIPASLGVHATIRCPWKLNGHLLNATLSSRVGCPCVDLWIPCGADVERQGPVEVNIIWTNLRARECRTRVCACATARYTWRLHSMLGAAEEARRNGNFWCVLSKREPAAEHDGGLLAKGVLFGEVSASVSDACRVHTK